VNNGATAYHLVGIGGIGMSAIARLLLARGAHVSGSDVRRTELVAALEAEGARVAIGHHADNVGDAHLVVVSSAIAHDNPEFVAALEHGIDIKTRGEMLAELTGARKTIAIAGTHGKTTTTAMTAAILEFAGLEPTFAVGGLRVDTGTKAMRATARFCTSNRRSRSSPTSRTTTFRATTSFPVCWRNSRRSCSACRPAAAPSWAWTIVEARSSATMRSCRRPRSRSIATPISWPVTSCTRGSDRTSR
jgi:hypothetical protein